MPAKPHQTQSIGITFIAENTLGIPKTLAVDNESVRFTSILRLISVKFLAIDDTAMTLLIVSFIILSDKPFTCALIYPVTYDLIVTQVNVPVGGKQNLVAE